MATRTQRLIVFALIAVPAALAVGYRYFAGQAEAGQPNWLFPEKAEPIALQVAPAVFADRTRFMLQQQTGENVISTTLPVKVTFAPVKLAKIPQTIKKSAQERELDVDLGEMHGSIVIIPGTAYLVRYANSELCEGDICPMALVTRKEGTEEMGEIIFSTKAKNMWVSNVKTNGNPDFFIDYGVAGMPPVRLYWDEEGPFPYYATEAPSLAKKLPDLPAR